MKKGTFKQIVSIMLVITMIITNINQEAYAAVYDSVVSYYGMAASDAADSQPEGSDITNDEDKLTLKFGGWGISSGDSTRNVDVSAGNHVDFSGQIGDTDAFVTLSYDASDVTAGDTFDILFPEGIGDISVRAGYASDEISYAITKDDAENAVRLSVKFQKSGDIAGKLTLDFDIAAGRDVSIVLQKFTDKTNEYKLTAPAKEKEPLATPTDAVKEEVENDDFASDIKVYSEDDDIAVLADVVENKFNINGSLSISDDGWTSLIRPLAFSQKMRVRAFYDDDNYVDYYAQVAPEGDELEMNFTHDGSGGGSFTIKNVSNMVTVDGEKKQVIKYEVTVDIDDSLPYYESEPTSSTIADVDMINNKETTSFYVTVDMTAKYETVNIKPEVIGEAEGSSFTFNAVYTNSASGVKTQKLTEAYTISGTESGGEVGRTIEVPVGIGYSYTQKANSEYKLSDTYNVVTTDKNGETTSSKQNGGGKWSCSRWSDNDCHNDELFHEPIQVVYGKVD